MKNFIRFNTEEDANLYELENVKRSVQPDGRFAGILIPKNGRLVINRVRNARYVSFHFWNYRILTYDASKEIDVWAGEEYLGKILIDHDHKNSYHTLPLKGRVDGSLELTLKLKIIRGDQREPFCIGISWSDTDTNEHQKRSSIPVATQGFTKSGSAVIWDYLSEFENFDVERSAEMRFVGRISNLHREIQSHDLIWNDGALKHFIGQMYYFYNRVDVHGYEVSIVHNDAFVIQMNKLFAELTCCSEELALYLDDPTFRFPSEYSEEFKNFPFVVIEGDTPKIFYKTSDKVRASFCTIVQRHLSAWLHSFVGKEFRVFFNLTVRVPFEDAVSFLGDEQKFIVVYRDPRNQYIQALQLSKSPDEPLHPDFETVDKFIAYFKHHVAPWIHCQKKNVLVLRFDDCIEHYEETVKRINTFLGCSEKNHVWKKMYFDPKESRRNLCLYMDYPDNSDIQKISSELGQYCRVPKIHFIKYQCIRLLSHIAFGNIKQSCIMRKQYDKKAIRYTQLLRRRKVFKEYFVRVFGMENPSTERINAAYLKADTNRIAEANALHKYFMMFFCITVVLGMALHMVNDPQTGKNLAFISLASSLAWLLTACSSKYRQSYWEHHVSMLEEKCGFKIYGLTGREFGKVTRDHVQGLKISMFVLSVIISIMSFVLFLYVVVEN